MYQTYRKLLRKLEKLIVITFLIFLALQVCIVVNSVENGIIQTELRNNQLLVSIVYELPILLTEIVAFVATKKSYNKYKATLRQAKKDEV